MQPRPRPQSQHSSPQDCVLSPPLTLPAHIAAPPPTLTKLSSSSQMTWEWWGVNLKGTWGSIHRWSSKADKVVFKERPVLQWRNNSSREEKPDPDPPHVNRDRVESGPAATLRDLQEAQLDWECFGGAATSVALRADRTITSLRGLPAAPQQTGRRSRGSFHPLRKLSAAYLPPSKDALQLPLPQQSQQYPQRIIPPKTSSLWTAALWKVLQVLQHENKQTQKQFFIPQPLLTQLQAPELDTPTLQCLVLAKQYE